MKLAIMTALIAIVLISGCVDFGGLRLGIGGETSSLENPDISLEITSIPTQVKAGRNITLTTNISNNRQTDLKDVSVTLYDPCFFLGNTNIIEDLELRPNRSKYVMTKLKAGDTSFERECDIKFKTEYTTDYNMERSIAVLQETEYYNRELQGTLGDISLHSSTTESPLNIVITFSEPLPFIDNDEVYMYIDYSYSGDGYITKIDQGDITIEFPSNLEVDCNDYELVEGGKCFGGTDIVCEDIGSDQVECKRLGCTPSEGCVAFDLSDPTSADCPTLGFDDCESESVCSWEVSCTGGTQSITCDIFDKSECVSGLYSGCLFSRSVDHVLNRNLTFIDKKASRSTCTLTTHASEPIDLRTLRLDAQYTYILDNSITVSVRPR